MEGRPQKTGARFYERPQFLWDTKSEFCRKQTAHENALQETVQDLNFPEITEEDV
jgi:hypothetical protein